VHYFDPHATYAPPGAYAEKLGVRRDDPLLAGGQNIVTFRSKPPGEKEIATLVALYDAEIAFTDAEIGRLLDGLGFGKLGKTVVVLTADHGEEFGDHGGMLHGRTLFEEMIHVPLLVAGGDLPSGRVVDTPVSLVSIAATLAELAEATPPADLAGRSLVRALHAAPDTPTMVFAELATTNAVHRGAAIDGTWKLVLNRGFVPSLYDLATDPAERTSLHESQGERRTILQKEIGAHNKVGSKARAAAPPMERSLSANRREGLRQLGDFE
jgi:arylsulfatase A-like enzyme